MHFTKSQKGGRKTKHLILKVKSALSNKTGEGYIDTAVKMIIAVVLGSLLLTGLYQLFNSVVLPGLADRIQSMF